MIDTPITGALLRGVAELEPTERGLRLHRLPAWARAQAPDPQLAAVEVQLSGVRVALRTQATVVELDVLRTTVRYPGGPTRPAGVYDLVVDGTVVDQQPGAGGDVTSIDLASGATTVQEGPVGTVRFTGLPDRLKRLEIWLPWNEETRLVALRTDAPVEPLVPDGRRTWVHHGSSISHGSDAASPTGTWPGRAALLGDVDLTNLGLGGSALLDPCVARVIRNAPADLISVKIGINLINTDLMRLRAFGPAVHGFLDTIREGHPDTPVLVISPLWCAMHEQTPGPTAFDEQALAAGQLRFRATGDPAEVAAGKLTLEIIRSELSRVVAQRAMADPHLTYLDGLELYGEADAVSMPLPDALHPDAATHRVIGERFATRVLGPGGPFAARAGRAPAAVS
ncbi:MAG TPA: GDSL-type esterase/lipase family protein [Friedmanniella sp.]